MILCSIAAVAKNRTIGNQSKLPWHIPEDLKYFKERTLGKKIIMGRKTYDSIGRPLPSRTNIILSRSQQERAAGVFTFGSLSDALKYCRANSAEDEEVFIIGGAEIYALAMPQVQRLYLTLIDQDYDGDAFFPVVDWSNDFKIVEKRDVQGSPSYSFIRAERR